MLRELFGTIAGSGPFGRCSGQVVQASSGRRRGWHWVGDRGSFCMCLAMTLELIYFLLSVRR